MLCQKCMVYVSDTLQHPPHPSSQHSGRFKPKRLAGCLETISYLLTRHIEKSRPDLFDWLNMMEMVNCGVLNQMASRDYRMYQIMIIEPSDINSIILLLIENSILAKCQDKFIYEEWFAEKAMFILGTIRQVHIDHSKHIYIEQKSDDDDPYR